MVRDTLGGGVQFLVSERKTICTDPGCEGPATETRIVTLGLHETRALVRKKASDTVRNDIVALQIG